MQVPITWENGRQATFTMLVVPQLSWPILFGQNHLRQTDAHIYSKALKVHFAVPSMNFTIKCYASNPLSAFPTIRPRGTLQGSAANVTCLLTPLPSIPSRNSHVSKIHLSQGFNLITVCLLITGSLLSSPLFSGPLWLEETTFSPGLQTLSGPIDLQAIQQTSPSGEFLPFYSFPDEQSCSSPAAKSSCPALLLSTGAPSSPDEVALNRLFTTQLLVHSEKGSAYLPQDKIFGALRPQTPDDLLSFYNASNHTAQYLVESWYSHTLSQGPVSFSAPLDEIISMSTQANTSNSSSVLSPFLSEQASDMTVQENLFPPTQATPLQSSSPEFLPLLYESLGLDTPLYAHVPDNIMHSFKNLLAQYPQAFHLPNTPLSTVKGFQHNIDTGEYPPVYQLPYRKSPSELKAIKDELERMLRLRIIQPSHSAWGAPCILVRKPLENGKPQPPRFVVDYRGLNAVTKGDGYPIPNVSNILDALSGGKLFARLDLASGYWQIPINPDHQHKTAFATHLGLYEFFGMPFGLKTAPQTFQRILNTVFSDYLYQWLIIYIDDCVTWSASFEEALSHYERIFARSVKYGLQFKPSKCAFFSTDLTVLGHRITPFGRFPSEKGTKAISNFPPPKTATQLKRFLGMVGYFREYISNLSTRCENLRTLLGKDTPFRWTDKHTKEFQDLKSALLSPNLILTHPDWDMDFEIHTDASKHGCGAMLAQWKHGTLRPIRFASRSFNPTEARWPTFHQEFYAIRWALEQFHHYVLGRKCKIITDHANLKFLASVAPQNSKLARWCLSLAEFDFTIEHRAGKANVVPDTFSRVPLPTTSCAISMAAFTPPEVISHFHTLIGTDISMALSSSAPLTPSLSLFMDIVPSSPPQVPSTVSISASSPTANPAACPATVLPPPKDAFKDMPVSAPLPADLQSLLPLNVNRVQLAQKQRCDPWLGPLALYLISHNSQSSLSHYSTKICKWVLSMAKRAKLIDGLLFYSDEFMNDPDHLRIFIPSDTTLQRHIIQAYHDSPIGMHRGRDATYHAISRDFYWRNLSKHVRNWVRRCNHCIRFKSLNQPHGPMQIRLYHHPFHTLGIDFVGELPASASGNKWILTIVCPFSNFLRAIPVPNKTATTTAHVLLHEVLLPFGFPAVLQSDRGGEFLNAVMHHLTSLLSIKHVFTSGFRPRLNGATERVHRFLNAAIGIYCERSQSRWEEFLQPAVYAHNTSPISGTSDITPFFLVFGRNAPSPETLSLQLPPQPLPADQYAHHLLQRMKDAHSRFSQIKSDLRRHQRELYDSSARDIDVPEGKTVFLRKDSTPPGVVSHFVRNYEGPFIVTGHPKNRSDLLTLRNVATGQDFPRPVNIEKVVVVPDIKPGELLPPEDPCHEPPRPVLPQLSHSANIPELASIAKEFGKYLNSLPSKSGISSQVCKFIYDRFPASRYLLATHGKLRGLVKAFPYLQLEGGTHGGTYILSLNSDLFDQII